MHIFSHDEHYQNVRQACAWMESLGVKFGTGRIAEYVRDCQIVAEHSIAGTSQEMLKEHNYSHLVNSMIESHEIVGIWQGLKSISDLKLPEELASIPFGKTLLAEESSQGKNSAPRNHAFHLYFKSLLARAGYVFGSHATCDIVLAQNPEIMIECKRAFGESGFEKGIFKGKHQLRGHYVEDPTRRGFIAVSVTRIPFPGERWEIDASTSAEMSEKTDARLVKLYQRFVRKVDQIIEPQTLGVVLYMLTPVYLESKLIIHGNLLLDPIREEARPFFNELSVRLKSVSGS